MDAKLISIHALREEGDEEFLAIPSDLYDFYPRPPRGGRRRHRWQSGREPYYFYPRPPRGGRLEFQSNRQHHQAISIHALREEGDQSFFKLFSILGDFYPRPPRGGRRGRARP